MFFLTKYNEKRTYFVNNNELLCELQKKSNSLLVRLFYIIFLAFNKSYLKS